MIVRQDGLGSNLPNSALISSGLSTAGGILGASGLFAALLPATFIPFVGPIIGGIALAVTALGIGNGCGQTCVVASQDADKIEPLLKQNVSAAQQQAGANNGCLTDAQKQAALQNFNDLWGALVNACSNPQLGDPGKRCVSDRQRGGKWDWFSYYYDPIASIPTCVNSSSDLFSSLGSGLGSSIWLIGGAGLILLALASGKD